LGGSVLEGFFSLSIEAQCNLGFEIMTTPHSKTWYLNLCSRYTSLGPSYAITMLPLLRRFNQPQTGGVGVKYEGRGIILAVCHPVESEHKLGI